jgi:uncharacterized phage-associated protein
MLSYKLRPRPPDAYDEAKAAEIAAFFALKEGGIADVLKLTKLMYLAERESFSRYARPLTGDRLSSMKDGPVLSETLNYIRCHGTPPRAWRRYFGSRDGNSLPLTDRDLREASLLQLSDADVELLNAVWEKFGHMDPHEIWVYVHENIPEYQDPAGSSKPIAVETMLRALGYADPEITEIVGRINEQNQFRAALKKVAV